MKCDKKTAFAVLKGAVNILTAIVLGAVALLFVLLGLNYRGLKFIADYYTVLVWSAAALTFVVLSLYVIFFLSNKQSLYRLLLCAIICADIFAVIFYIISATGLIQKITSIETLQNYIDGFGPTAVIIFIVFSFLQVVVLPVPGSVTVAAGVALFGPRECALYSFIGILAGSLVAFAIGRWIGYKAVCWIVGKDDIDKWLEKIKGKDYLILSLMFLLPLFPDDVLCFVAGLSSMTWPYFIIMIIITRLISCFTVAYSLDLIPFNTWWGITIWIVIFALVALAFYLVCKFSDKIDAFIKKKFKIKGRTKK